MKGQQHLPIPINQGLIYHRFLLLGVETYIPHLRDVYEKYSMRPARRL